MTLPLHSLRVRAATLQDPELIELLVQREAVVPVTSPRDLARRLARDRRVLAVLHPSGAPLAFIHVALTSSLPRTLDEVLAGPLEVGPARHATFYGITRVDPRARGRAGQLLEAAMEHVLEELDSVQVAATLSPMPGFRAWVQRTMEAAGLPGAAEERAA